SLATGSVTPLTQDLNVDFYPTWSPDGSRLVYVNSDFLTTTLRSVDISTGLVATIAFNAAIEAPRFAPDSARVAFTSSTGGSTTVSIVDVLTGATTTLDAGNTGRSFPVFSPAGGDLAS